MLPASLCASSKIRSKAKFKRRAGIHSSRVGTGWESLGKHVDFSHKPEPTNVQASFEIIDDFKY